MRKVTTAQAKRDHSIGFLTYFRLERAPLKSGWLIVLGEGLAEGFLVDAARKEHRVFKSLDGAVSALEDIGFTIEALFKG
ncbi:MAG: hypothetical protein Q8L80_13135 [Gallionella sp.]|nr:hypothetical protein [Gallionella sp.]MDP1942123.1 hypothetical protein [Gallionella sp.]